MTQQQFIITLAVLVLLLSSPVFAFGSRTGHITLLTVTDDQHSGGTADLYLEVRPGSGAIFIDSFPLTRLDTQGSTRYANQIACDFLGKDCSRYDFFYTIRANSAIVGGPSAGAAMTVLTVAVLDNQELNQSIAMTGTINSGGVIGPVAGIVAKVAGAKRAGITTVLIPSLTPDGGVERENHTITQTRGVDENLSIDGVRVLRVGTIEEALETFTKKKYAKEYPALLPTEEYNTRMRVIAQELCNRTQMLSKQALQEAIPLEDPNNYTARIAALPEEHQYSLASLCFSRNIELSTSLLNRTSVDERLEIARVIRNEVRQLDEEIRNKEIAKISDLETYGIVRERLLEAKTLLDDLNTTSPDPRTVAYAQERTMSAKSWSSFFGMAGREVIIDDNHLRKACLSKLSEAEERIGYVRLYSDGLVEDSDSRLEKARSLADTEPILCIITASQAKAQANLIASALSLGSDDLRKLLSEKMIADERVIQKQIHDDMFPLLGFSYFQYAGDLAETSPSSGLIFAEYALELSNLDLYFPQKKSWRPPVWAGEVVWTFAFGAVFGVAITLLIIRFSIEKHKPKMKQKHSRRKP